MFFDTQVNKRLSTTTRSTKGKQNTFGISRKRVMPVKYSRQKVPQLKLLSSPSKEATRVNLLRVSTICFMLLGIAFTVDWLGQALLVTQVGKTFCENIPKLLDPTSSETPSVVQASERLVSAFLQYQELVLCSLEQLSQLTSQDRPYLVTQVGKNFL